MNTTSRGKEIIAVVGVDGMPVDEFRSTNERETHAHINTVRDADRKSNVRRELFTCAVAREVA